MKDDNVANERAWRCGWISKQTEEERERWRCIGAKGWLVNDENPEDAWKKPNLGLARDELHFRSTARVRVELRCDGVAEYHFQQLDWEPC